VILKQVRDDIHVMQDDMYAIVVRPDARAGKSINGQICDLKIYMPAGAPERMETQIEFFLSFCFGIFLVVSLALGIGLIA
jgi:hypothetical protein